MIRLASALLLIAAAGCASTPHVVEAGGDFIRPDENSFNVHLKYEKESWMLTVGYGGEIANEPRILLDGKPVELRRGVLSGFGLYFQATYEIERSGAYRIEQRDKPDDEKPRAAYSFVIR